MVWEHIIWNTDLMLCDFHAFKPIKNEPVENIITQTTKTPSTWRSVLLTDITILRILSNSIRKWIKKTVIEYKYCEK
jgi:hypothetical protein